MTATKKAIGKLTKAEARVEIAKDVLKHLKAMKVTRGIYCGSNGPPDHALEKLEGDAQQHVGVIQKSCHVCALGSMMVSHIRKFDNFGMDEFLFGRLGREQIAETLGKWFSQSQLDLIETAFETYPGKDNREAYEAWETGAKRKAKLFGNRFKTDRQRLKGIMENIVKNKGTFKPEQEQ